MMVERDFNYPNIIYVYPGDSIDDVFDELNKGDELIIAKPYGNCPPEEDDG